MKSLRAEVIVKICYWKLNFHLVKEKIFPTELVKDSNFYVRLVDSKPVLKPNHLNGYYLQIQLAMGLSGVENCDFTVYTFKGTIII